MELKPLNRVLIEQIYNERMEEDFPPSELKPLNIILEAVSKNIYECYGLFDKEEIAGYIFLIKCGNDYLIDYLATYPERRNSGLGGIMIQLIGEKLKDAQSIIGEVENPDFATNESDRSLQRRRINFYFRNGFRDTNVKAECFGVPFILIETGPNLIHSEEEIKALYRMHYQAILSKEMYEKNIMV